MLSFALHPSPTLLELLRPTLATIGSSPFVGLHMRVGDAIMGVKGESVDTRIEDASDAGLRRCVKVWAECAERYPGPIFLATDTVAVRDMLAREIGDRRRIIELNLGHVEHNRLLSKDGPMDVGGEFKAGRQTIGDFFMLTLADTLVAGSVSTFSESANLLGAQKHVDCRCRMK